MRRNRQYDPIVYLTPTDTNSVRMPLEELNAMLTEGPPRNAARALLSEGRNRDLNSSKLHSDSEAFLRASKALRNFLKQ